MRPLLALLLPLLLSLPAAAEVPRRKITKIAVPETNVRAGVERATVDGLGLVLADEAGKREGVAVVSAAEIAAMIGLERQKQLMGCSDASCLAEIGGALGADLLLTSEISKIGGQWLVSVSLVEVGKARVLGRATRDVARDVALVSATRDAANQALDAWATPVPTWTTGEIAAVAAMGGGALLAVIGGYVAITSFAEADRVVADAASYDAKVKEDEAAAKGTGTTAAIVGGLGLAAAVGGAIAWPQTGRDEEEPVSLALLPVDGGGELTWSLRF